MKRRRRAFSLLELLIVIAIIAVLAAILIPVANRARFSAKVETSKQYLRQQFIAVELYSQSSDGRLPNWETIKATKKMQAPCSPLDRWKPPCWSRSAPMLGSYGYAPAVEGIEYPFDADAVPLLADPFAGRYVPLEFQGMANEPAACRPPTLGCELPETIWYAFTDGSLRKMTSPEVSEASIYSGRVRAMFDWPTVFNLMYRRTKDGRSAR